MEDGFRRGRAASTIFYHPKTQVRVVVHGDDVTFAGTESELKRIQAKMHEWYDVKVGSGKRDVHEIEILGRNLTWTEEGLEYEGSDKHRQALLEGLGLNEESKSVNSAAVKPEEIGQEEDTEMFAGHAKFLDCWFGGYTAKGSSGAPDWIFKTVWLYNCGGRLGQSSAQ